MANILFVTVNDLDISAADELTVSAAVWIQVGSTPHNLGSMNRAVSMKTLGVYNTAIQFNQLIADEAVDFADQNGYSNAWNFRYVAGGFGSLTVL